MRNSCFFYVLALMLVLGCGATKDLMQKDDRESFQYSTDRYYKLIQWKYYEKAVQFVDPQSAREYESFVFRNQKDLNITAYQIKDVTFIDPSDIEEGQTGDPDPDSKQRSGDTDRATVRVYYTYFKYPSVTEEGIMIEDTWIKIGKLWYVSSDYPEGTF
jgi:hypothetical protein